MWCPSLTLSQGRDDPCSMLFSDATATHISYQTRLPQMIRSCHRTVPPVDTTYQPGYMRFEGAAL